MRAPEPKQGNVAEVRTVAERLTAIYQREGQFPAAYVEAVDGPEDALVNALTADGWVEVPAEGCRSFIRRTGDGVERVTWA